ncbi:MAG TPA: hypothetical protein VGC41_08845, partial [Kofleriaceae bacterium]
MRGFWAFIGVAGCSFSPSNSAPSDGRPLDATVLHDGKSDAPAPGQLCVGTLAYDKICWDLAAHPPQTGVKTFSGSIGPIDTASSQQCDRNAMVGPDNPCVIAADSIVIDTDLRLLGPGGVVFVATTGAIQVTAGHNVNAGALAQAGAGGLAECTGSVAPVGSGGGFGGSFTVRGGNGGDSDEEDEVGGESAPAHDVASINGGCPGGFGGGPGADPGFAGGAVILIGTSIQLDGKILAFGGGGKGSQAAGKGGGGGGAGGLIVLDAPTITSTGG